MARAKAATTTRLSLSALARLLDFPEGVEVTGATVEGDLLVLALTGTDIEGDLIADYTVGGRDGRRFNGFKAQGDEPATDDGESVAGEEG